MNDKIKGAIYGFALGDALGLATEFMTRSEARSCYPEGIRSFDGYLRDAHRCLWSRGEYTNDTLFLLCALENIIRVGDLDVQEYARDLHRTFSGHSTFSDLTPVARALLSTPGWTENPLSKAAQAWHDFGLSEATNDPNNRGIAAGILAPDQTTATQWARKMALVTSPDSRCTTSTMSLALMAYKLFHTGKPADYEDIIDLCYTSDARTVPYIDIAYNGSIEDLHLDDAATMMYTRKATGAALWAIWHTDNPADAIFSVIDQAGDADSNAALAGALSGLRYGFDALPDLKYEIMGRDRLDDVAERVSRYVDKNGNC